MKKMRKTKMRSKKNARKTKRIRGGAAAAEGSVTGSKRTIENEYSNRGPAGKLLRGSNQRGVYKSSAKNSMISQAKEDITKISRRIQDPRIPDYVKSVFNAELKKIIDETNAFESSKEFNMNRHAHHTKIEKLWNDVTNSLKMTDEQRNTLYRKRFEELLPN